MIFFPNAKINLGLRIVSKRSDGYHNIETVFYPVNLCDALEIVPAQENKTTFIQTGIKWDDDFRNNLVMKAYYLLKAYHPIPEIVIYLRKHIPVGAGLGGGSSDAAFMLKLLNEYAGLQLSISQLEEYAGRIGSDCPFFIRNQPVFAEGTGTIFSPVTVSLQGYYLVLVKPDIYVSTQKAYACVKPHSCEEPVKEIVYSPVSEWKNRLINDFEAGIFSRYPEIGKIKQQLYDSGALYASMSGSGSTVFGIFEKPGDWEEKFINCLVYSFSL
jgi:4-diphosphocytidyl-2-C-methyl-D-erythritol kinase